MRTVVGTTLEKPVTYVENAIYNSSQVSRILGRSTKCVRNLCRSGRIRAKLDRCGFMILGSAITEYLNSSCDFPQLQK